MQIVSVTVPSKHQITRINGLELTFLNSKQKKSYNLKVTTQN